MGRKKKVTCPHCSANFECEICDAGWGDQEFFYCSACSNVAVIDGQSQEGLWGQVFFQKYIHGEKSRTEELRKEKRKMMVQEILGHLESCTCGSKFTDEAIPRCPVCNKELEYEVLIDQLSEFSVDPSYFKSVTQKDRWKGRFFCILNNRFVRNPWQKI